MRGGDWARHSIVEGFFVVRGGAQGCRAEVFVGINNIFCESDAKTIKQELHS